MCYTENNHIKGGLLMAKVAILVPQEEMCALAAPLVPEFSNISLMCLDYINYNETHLAVSRAREMEAQGCELIIARGVQSRMIKYNTSIPVVEIQITTQELGMVMLELKRELASETPRLGLICFANMIGDTSHFNELFGIDLKVYFVKSSEELSDTVDQAVADGCQSVIGGNIVCERARAMGMPCRFLPAGAESLKNALATASRVCYAIDQEKQNLTEMDTMLNNTFSGIMQVDKDGIIQRINRTGYTLLQQMPNELLGHKATEAIPNLNKKLLDDALLFGSESYAFVMNIRQKAVVMNIAPICIDEEIRGAILTFQEGKRIIDMDSELRRELYQRGYIAKYSFDSVITKSKEMQELVKMGKRIAKYPAPILLTGETGSGKSMIAQCIHKESLYQNSAFIDLDCSAWLPETLDDMLFGNYSTRKDAPPCIAEMAQNGTLYLSHVEYLLLETQYKLLNLIHGRFLHNGSNSVASANVRVLASSDCNLIAKVEKGEFRRDLYYALSVLSLEVLPLRRRKEDIPDLVNYSINEYQEKYKRYIQLTNGARQFIREYDWPGNMDQIKSVCERVVLLTEKRNVDEVFLRKQLELVTPKLTAEAEKVVVVKDYKAIEIMELLEKHGGNREKVAEELGISKTTLWRHMKKFGIEANYK